jgi:MYXO-CTERM domain-containing protein
MDEASGWMWFVIDVIAVGLLGLALAYGIWAWRRRRKSPTIERARDEATRRAYEQSDGAGR